MIRESERLAAAKRSQVRSASADKVHAVRGSQIKIMIGPLSGIMFLVGLVMIFVGKNRNNDDLFRWDFRDNGNDGEFNRQKFFFIGILLVIAAVVIWFYLMFFDGGDVSEVSGVSAFVHHKTFLADK